MQGEEKRAHFLRRGHGFLGSLRSGAGRFSHCLLSAVNAERTAVNTGKEGVILKEAVGSNFRNS